MKRILFFFLLSSIFVGLKAQNVYDVYKLSGYALNFDNHKPLKVGAQIKPTAVVDFSRCQQMALLDKNSRKVYYLKEKGRVKIADAVARVRQRAGSVSMRLLNTILATTQENHESWGQLGASMRGSDDELDANTEAVYHQLRLLVKSGANQKTASLLNIEVEKIYRTNTEFCFRILNSDTIPVFYNVASVSNDGRLRMLYATDDEMPCLMIGAKSDMALDSETFLQGTDKYVLVASDSPFCSEDLEEMCNSEEAINNASDRKIRIKTVYLK